MNNLLTDYVQELSHQENKMRDALKICSLPDWIPFTLKLVF